MAVVSEDRAEARPDAAWFVAFCMTSWVNLATRNVGFVIEALQPHG